MIPSTSLLSRTARRTDPAPPVWAVSTRIRPPGCPIAAQRVPPSATSPRALSTGTSATARVACTIRASGIWNRGRLSVPLGSGGVGEVPAKAELAAGRGVGTGTAGSAEHPASSTMTNPTGQDRKSTRLNSSHVAISYAVFCLKKKKKKKKKKPENKKKKKEKKTTT